MPGPSLKTLLLPAWACINGVLQPHNTLLPSLSAHQRSPTLSLGGRAAIPTPLALPGVNENNDDAPLPGTLGWELRNETMPALQQFMDDPQSYSDWQQNRGVDQDVFYNMSKSAYLHSQLLQMGGEPGGPNGKWFPEDFTSFNRIPWLLWGQPMLLTVAKSEEPVAQAAASLRDEVGHEVWDAIARIAYYMGQQAAADLHRDELAPPLLLLSRGTTTTTSSPNMRP